MVAGVQRKLKAAAKRPSKPGAYQAYLKALEKGKTGKNMVWPGA